MGDQWIRAIDSVAARGSFFLFFFFFFFLIPATVMAKMPADFLMAEQWYLETIGAYQAWETTVGSREVIVAVLDTGIDLEHEDLKGNFWVNNNEALDGRDNDNNGYEDDVRGWDFIDNDTDPSPTIGLEPDETAISHGTVVAGLIGAMGDNGLGIAGLNWQVRLMPLRVLDEEGSGSSRDVARAVDYAVENGASVINLSFVTDQYDPTLAKAVKRAVDDGVVVVTAVGNFEATGRLIGPSSPSYPACFDAYYGEDLIIGVAASDTADAKANFSNYGAPCTDLAAPGVSIFGTVFYDEALDDFSSRYGGPWEGTSFSAAAVSGAAALIRSEYPSLTARQTRLSLQLAAVPLNEDDRTVKREMGSGRLDISRALALAGRLSLESVSSERSNVKTTTSHSLAAAAGAGSAPVVRRMDGQGTVLASFLAFDENFRGGVRLAMGDVNGDGQDEIIVGAGPGGGPQVRIFDLNGRVVGQFFADDEDGRFGIYVAVGDIDGDGVEEIIVSPDHGRRGQVRLFNVHGELLGAFYPLGRTSEAVKTATGNADDDPEDELFIWSPRQDNNSILVYDGSGRYVRQFSISGESVAVADLDGDGQDEVIVSRGAGNSPLVSVFSREGELRRSFTPFDARFLGGAQVAAGDIDNNGQDEIYTTAGPGGGPQIRIFNSGGAVIGGFFAFDPFERYGAVAAIN